MAKLLILLFLIVAVSTSCSHTDTSQQTVSTNAAISVPIKQLEAAFSQYHLENHRREEEVAGVLGEFEFTNYTMKVLEKHSGRMLLSVNVNPSIKLEVQQNSDLDI